MEPILAQTGLVYRGDVDQAAQWTARDEKQNTSHGGSTAAQEIARLRLNQSPPQLIALFMAFSKSESEITYG